MREDYSEELRATDPVAHEPGLSAAEIQVMRRTIVAAAADTPQPGWSPGPAALTVALAFTLVLGVFVGTRLEPVREESTQPQVNEQRQLQFETPGGTRVVWVLNSNLDL